jgi:WD40 repeat protein
VRLWDPTSGTPVGTPLRGDLQALTAVAFGTGGDGRPLLASGGKDGTVHLWDPTSSTPVGTPLTGHTSWVKAVAFGADAKGRPLLASASNDGTVQLWDPTPGTPVGTLLRRTIPTAIATFNTQLAIADTEGITIVEVMDPSAEPTGAAPGRVL